MADELAIWSLFLQSINLAAQMTGTLPMLSTQRDLKRYGWINARAAKRAAVGGYFQLRMVNTAILAMDRILHGVSGIYPLHPRAHKSSGIPRDDFRRFEIYYRDMEGHVDRLVREHNIVSRYLGSVDRSSIDADLLDLLQELETIEEEIRQLQENRNVDLQFVKNRISVVFVRTEARLGQQLAYLEERERQEEGSPAGSEGSVKDKPAAAERPAAKRPRPANTIRTDSIMPTPGGDPKPNDQPPGRVIPSRSPSRRIGGPST